MEIRYQLKHKSFRLGTPLSRQFGVRNSIMNLVLEAIRSSDVLHRFICFIAKVDKIVTARV